MPRTQPPPDSAWCESIFASRSNVVRFTPTCRLEPDSQGFCPTQDQLFRRSLRTSDTIPNSTGFYTQINMKDLSGEAQVAAGTRLLIPSSTLVFDLRQGVKGFNGTAHGGLISALIDEAMGSLIFINDKVFREMLAKNAVLPASIIRMDGVLMFTASMDVRFRKPLPLPKIVLIQATLSKIEGRRLFFNVTVADDKQTLYAECTGMWMSVSKGVL